MARLRPLLCGLAVMVAIACAAPTGSDQDPLNPNWTDRVVGNVTYRYTAVDAGLVSTVTPVVAAEAVRMTEFLGLPFERAYRVTVFPSRAPFDDRVREVWNAPQFDPPCWIIATASTTGVELLSPRAWEPSCGHQASSSEHLRIVLAHELVHVLHAQRPQSGYRYSMRWLAEGLAVYASDQLDAEYGGQARARLSQGFIPTSLQALVDEEGGYPLTGDLVRYVDRVWGRAALRDLTRATTTAEALAMLGETEASLLSRWRAASGS